MRTVRTVTELRAALLEARRAGARIGLVPTMGAFHAGHLSLMRSAREECDVVVVSLFVNPAQFNEASDLDAYPRDEAHDGSLAAATGVDYLFTPDVDEIYPDGFATTVSVRGLTDVLEGERRGREHFDGVTTVVAKLLSIVGPDVAFFGQKDAQQALVVQRMVLDLGIPARIEVCATVREPDGLAMSSRNLRLSEDERRRATALHRALDGALAEVSAGERDAAVLTRRARALLDAADVETEYFELVQPGTLKRVQEIDGPVLAVVAAWVGATRLIDNQMLSTKTGYMAATAGSATTGRL
jgi:pantoate--beta-alanine ligase